VDLHWTECDDDIKQHALMVISRGASVLFDVFLLLLFSTSFPAFFSLMSLSFISMTFRCLPDNQFMCTIPYSFTLVERRRMGRRTENLYPKEYRCLVSFFTFHLPQCITGASIFYYWRKSSILTSLLTAFVTPSLKRKMNSPQSICEVFSFPILDPSPSPPSS
jgi:hypothetical protein